MSNIKHVIPNPPTTFQKYIVTSLNNDFEKATSLVNVPFATLLDKIQPNQVILRYAYVGINASDINYTAGRYDPSIKPPFDCGFEGIGEVIATGRDTNIQLYQPVAVMNFGTFAEYQIVSEKMLIPIPKLDKKFLCLLVSGLTSELALKYHAGLKKKDVVLVTAAAGGAGQIAVQLAKSAGNHVIGTCSSGKEEFLKKLGVDRVINYKKEDFYRVLKNEYPNGIDVVFESVGGQMLQSCIKSLAVKGRLIVIGAVSTYASEVAVEEMKSFKWDAVETNILVSKSCTITGFFLNHYANEFPLAMQRLTGAMKNGSLKLSVHHEDFVGISSIPQAIKCMHSGKNIGKMVVDMIGPFAKI